MRQNPYEVLGLSNGASKQEVEEAYLRLRDKYRLDMHSEGAKGKEAAKKLNEVENAYNDILVNYCEGGVPVTPENDYAYGDSGYTGTQNYGESETKTTPEPEILDSDYERIEQLIREKKFMDAQKALDNIDNRNAAWHFYQSVIYYKLGRMQESKAQLELACSMDPSNQRYRNSLDKLNNKLNGNSTDVKMPQGNYGNDNGNGYHRSYGDYDNARASEDTCCQVCQTLICLNCLCDCCCSR